MNGQGATAILIAPHRCQRNAHFSDAVLKPKFHMNRPKIAPIHPDRRTDTHPSFRWIQVLAPILVRVIATRDRNARSRRIALAKRKKPAWDHPTRVRRDVDDVCPLYQMYSAPNEKP